LGSEADLIAGFIVGLAAILLIIGILEIIGSVGVFVHKGWARWLGIVLATIGLVIGFLVLIGTFLPPAGGAGDVIFALLWLAAHRFVVAALAARGEHFQPAYPRR